MSQNKDTLTFIAKCFYHVYYDFFKSHQRFVFTVTRQHALIIKKNYPFYN